MSREERGQRTEDEGRQRREERGERREESGERRWERGGERREEERGEGRGKDRGDMGEGKREAFYLIIMSGRQGGKLAEWQYCGPSESNGSQFGAVEMRADVWPMSV